MAMTIFRIVLSSVTKRLPAPSLAIPDGMENCAAGPVPSLLPQFPGEPARVVTAPVATTIFRIVVPATTKRLPAPSLATLNGPLNRAAAPVPSSLPALPGEPAEVVVDPRGDDDLSYREVVRHKQVARAIAGQTGRASEPRRCACAVVAARVAQGARQRGDDTRGNDDLSYRVVARIGDEEVACTVGGHALRRAGKRRGTAAIHRNCQVRPTSLPGARGWGRSRDCLRCHRHRLCPRRCSLRCCQPGPHRPQTGSPYVRSWPPRFLPRRRTELLF